MEVTCSLLSRSRCFSCEGNDGKIPASTGAMHVTENVTNFSGSYLQENLLFLLLFFSYNASFGGNKEGRTEGQTFGYCVCIYIYICMYSEIPKERRFKVEMRLYLNYLRHKNCTLKVTGMTCVESKDLGFIKYK
jgi:hypothetical protein